MKKRKVVGWMTNRDNSYRLAESIEAVSDNTLHYTQGVSYATLSATPQSHNLVTFNGNNGPVMEFRNNGDIYVQGRLATNDMEVVDAMRLFLAANGWMR